MLQLKKNQQIGRVCLQGGEIFAQGVGIAVQRSHRTAYRLFQPLKGLGAVVIWVGEKINHGSIGNRRYVYAPITSA